ncbi:MAG: response regulator [Bryobacteraceae bacterium]|jgi:PAS domain S-box-containing protein
MKPRVLIVDDSLTVRMDIGEALQSAGFDTVLCADLRSAREALAREGSVLIVLDILLPDGDGLDFLKELRSSPATAQIPVLLLSTEADAKNRVRGMGAGADEYIGKPYDLGLLVARARALTQADASGGVGLGRRVLVIDDSVTFRDELRQSLEGAGYHVREAATGEEGLALAAADRPDAVVVDGILPGIDGATVVRRLKSDTALRSTPCLLLTGAEGTNDGLRALEAGADAYVRKSEDLGVILVRLAALLRGAIATGGETSPSLLGPKRLLAVDDSITYLQELGSQLRREGYHVVMASSGEEALELLAARPVDGILLDLVMPGLSGQDTCKRIKQRAEWRDIPLIMLTARDDRDAMIEGINAGADDYIAKSADFDVLKARLRAQLRRKYFEDENRRIREKLVRRETEATAREQGEAEQKKLDQRLRDQQFYTRSLIESNIDALMTTDPLGIITDVNKQMEALTGCTRDELIGAPSKNYFTDPERAEAAIKLVLREKKVTDYELTARARDGKKTEVSYNATTFYDRDRTLQGVLAIARDVTERKRNEQALQETNIELASAKSAAEEANLAKSDFLSSMSHELRSPLNAILGFAQLMELASPLPTDSQKESIAQILQAGWHLLKLINEILDLSVIESGKVSLSTESVSLAEVMSECQAMMEPQAQQLGIGMTFPRFDNPFFVSADRTRLKQIVINLLSNAIKYNKEQGTVVVDCTTSTPGFTRISVKDTGAGLSPEKLAQLFQPFNRLGQEAGGVAGTGIGLVVTKRLAELMGGVLGVESTAGEGSVFWCELISCAAPELVVESGEAATVDRPPVPAGARPRTLLYVEDNPANMKLVEQLIARRPDMRLLTAVNGTLGIEVARTTRPTVILMDINLPGISGVEALKVLRIDPATAHIPVVALSANAMPRDIEMGLDAGFFRYLTKPIKIKEFMDTLNTALEFAEEELCRRK